MSAKCMLRPANSKRMLVFIVKFFCPEKAGDSQDNFHILSNLSTHLGGNSVVWYGDPHTGFSLNGQELQHA